MITDNGPTAFEDFDYTIDVNAIETNCTGCGVLCAGPDGPCLAGYNHWALKRIDGKGEGPDDVLSPVDPGGTIPLQALLLAAAGDGPP
ncbi:hypothetical protein [Streptomyces sp. NPDC056661]|uniref:hypothetical protein n=1 Tax=Streptomyces sp. NPDC056661 TaxID=3345898 RepID=UPI0036905DAF